MFVDVQIGADGCIEVDGAGPIWERVFFTEAAQVGLTAARLVIAFRTADKAALRIPGKHREWLRGNVQE